MAYLAGWSIPAVIHPEKITHINFAFARINAAGQAALANGELEASLLRLVALKKTNPRLKVIVSIGGWMADGFSDAALTDDSRALFADSAVELLRQFSADGIDIDWEYPGQGVAGIKYRAEDRQNFTRLLKVLRDKLDGASTAQGRTGGARYTLTIASADREYFDHTEMDKLHTYLDWINVMSQQSDADDWSSRGTVWDGAGIAHRSRCRCLGQTTSGGRNSFRKDRPRRRVLRSRLRRCAAHR